ncbi:SH3 domain-containing protein [Streptomyces odontomachi]|uniref:SH3 domain-containing protein n=1 Tax=Streptomyces odontomachi TaxID=2944940 RepID=UPI00210C9CF5|nr:SH3 domain-containing protein [Streptomyces sp. ODS25]
MIFFKRHAFSLGLVGVALGLLLATCSAGHSDSAGDYGSQGAGAAVPVSTIGWGSCHRVTSQVSGLRLRARPGYDGAVLALMYPGTTMDPLYPVNSEWTRVRVTSGPAAGWSGYVSKLYLNWLC